MAQQAARVDITASLQTAGSAGIDSSPSKSLAQERSSKPASKRPHSTKIHKSIVTTSVSTVSKQSTASVPPSSDSAPAQTPEVQSIDYEEKFRELVQSVPIDAVTEKADVLRSLSEARFVFNHYVDLLQSKINEKREQLNDIEQHSTKEAVGDEEIERIKQSLIGLEKKLKNFPKHINKLEALNAIIRRDPFAMIVPVKPENSSIGEFYNQNLGSDFVHSEYIIRIRCGFDDDRILTILSEYDLYNAAFVDIKAIRRNLNVT